MSDKVSQSKQQLIDRHNTCNLYVDIAPYILCKELPIIRYEQIGLELGEDLIYVAPVCIYRNGKFETSDFVITSKRVVIQGVSFIEEFALKDLASCLIINDETLEIQYKKVNKLIISNAEILPYIYIFLAKAINSVI